MSDTTAVRSHCFKCHLPILGNETLIYDSSDFYAKHYHLECVPTTATTKMQWDAVTERNAYLERELASLTAERDKLREELNATEKLRAHVNVGLSAMMDERDKLRGELAEAKAEVERMKARANGLFEENATLAGECVNLARAPQALTQRLAKWREVAEALEPAARDWASRNPRFRTALIDGISDPCGVHAALAAFDKLQKEEPK